MVHRAFIEHLARGERLRREGMLAEATEEFLAAVRLRPDHAGALFELGRLYFKQWRDEEAKFYLSLVVKKTPNHLEAHRLLGITCFQLEDWRGAEKYLGRATRLSQEEVPEIWALLAMVSWQQGKLNQAYGRCEKALELDTTSALPYIVKGLVLAEIEDVQAAKVAISEAVDCEPDTWYPHYLLGQWYAATGDVKAARSEYLLAAQCADFPPAVVYEALLAVTGEPQEQMLCLEQIVANRPTDVASRKKLIRLYLTAHRLNAVPDELQALNSILEGQEDGETLLLRGDYYALQGQLESALGAYHEAASLMPKHPDPFYRLGEVLSLLEKDEEAIGCLREAIRLRRWDDTDYTYKPIFQSERVEENRDRARGDGIGPFDLLWAMIYALIYSAWKWLQGRISSLKIDSVHRFIKARIIFHPRIRQWLVIVTLFCLPLALFDVLAFRLLFGRVSIIVYIFLVLLTTCVLSQLPVKPTWRNILRLVLASIPGWLGILGLFAVPVWSFWNSLGMPVQLPSTITDWSFLAMMAYIFFIFSLGLTATVWINYMLLKKLTGIKTFRELLKVPWLEYRRLRHKFVREWGFSGLYFDCLLPLLTASLLTALAETVDQLWWLAYPSWALNFFIFMVLNLVFIDYAFSPRPIKRIKLDKLKGVLGLRPGSSFYLPLALLITAALFWAYWTNYSLVLTNSDIVNPGSFISLDQQSPDDLGGWHYITFRLMISGEFDMIPQDPYAEFVIMAISMSEFAFLGLFFTQIIGTLRVYGKTKENERGSGNE